MDSDIYLPNEDSYLLSETLRKRIPELLKENYEPKILEIGIGSGIQLETLKNIGVKNIFGSDINAKAVKICRSKGFNCVKSDLFNRIKGKFDIIIFNPPYLPLDGSEPKESRMATTGGKNGSEIINNFLRQAKNYLNENGKIFLLTSSLTIGINWKDYEKKLISKKKLFFEELFVWELG